MFNSLYTKLVLVLFVLFILIGSVFMAVAFYTAPMYQQEVSQQLNRDLAMYIVSEHVLIENGSVRHDNLEALFHKAMIINPSLALYLLDKEGGVMAHSMPLEKIKQNHVSLAPINQFLAGPSEGLIMGDDPSSESQRKGFSVAPIDFDGQRQGYIYAILGSEKIDHITEILQRSLIMKWSAGVVLAALALAFVAALILFYFLMRKLHVLNHSMQTFKDNQFQNEITLARSHVNAVNRGDEIDNMALTFQDMARHIHLQMNRLQETDSLRRELVANVSHDLRTPLASLSGYIETLLLKSADLTEEDKQAYLKIAFDNSKRLSTLVEELFELAKLDANEIQPQYELFSLAELTYDVSHKFHLRADEQQISLDIEVDETIPYVNADVSMIERVLDNLIDNSFKHTPKGGCIRLQLSSIKTNVQLAVSDTGYGIHEEEIPHIFKRFYKKGDSHADIGAGLGLGLAIAARIIELHGGRLSVDSVLHQGTTFQFSLPKGASDSEIA